MKGVGAIGWWIALVVMVLVTRAGALEVQLPSITITGGSALPFYTSNQDSRTQSIYLASESGSSGRIRSMTINVSTIPGQMMTNCTIRVLNLGESEFANEILSVDTAAETSS